MTANRQIQLVTALTAVFIAATLLFVVLLTYQQRNIQSTIDTNSARRDTQLNGLLCVAALLPDNLTAGNVVQCLKGVQP